MSATAETATKPTIKAGDTFVCPVAMHQVKHVGWTMGRDQYVNNAGHTKYGRCLLSILETLSTETLGRLAVVRKKYVTPNGESLHEGRIVAKPIAVVERDIERNGFKKKGRDA